MSTQRLLAPVIKLSVFSGLAIAGTALGQTTLTYSGPSGGNWTQAANWTPGNVPDDPTESVVLGGGNAYSVNMDATTLIDALRITNLNASLTIPFGNTLSLVGAEHTVNGTINVGGGGTNAYAVLRFETDSRLKGQFGPRTIALQFRTGGGVETGLGTTLTIDPGVTIRGHGYLQGNFVSSGLILSDIRSLSLKNSTYVRQGNGQLKVSGTTYGSSNAFSISNSTLTGPQLSTSAGGAFFYSGVTMTGATLDGAHVVSDTLIAGGTLTVGSTDPSTGLMLGGRYSVLTLAKGTTVTGIGSIQADFGSATIACPTGASSATVDTGVTIASPLVITGNLMVNGGLDLSRIIYSPAPMQVSDEIVLGSSAVTTTVVRPAGGTGRLTGAGTKTLAGKLIVKGSGGYVPPCGPIEIVSGPGTRIGKFSTTQLPFLPGGRKYIVLYTPTSVILHVTSIADITGQDGLGEPDALLSPSDVVVFFNDFFAGCGSGNTPCNKADVTNQAGDGPPDGLLTANDVVLFFSSFFGGCS